MIEPDQFDEKLAAVAPVQRFVRQHRQCQASTFVRRPKIAEAPTHPLMKPRLLPIWKRCPSIAFTRCRYSAPRTLHRTMSPVRIAVWSTGATVHSWPDLILGDIEFPRGRKDTVSPACSFLM